MNKKTIKVNLGSIMVGGSRHPPTRALETPYAPMWRETWFYEQLLFVFLLAIAGCASWQLLASKGPVSTRDAFLLVLSLFGQFIAQKARSASARQTALAKRASFVAPEVRCASKIKRWTTLGQVLGSFMGVATAPSWAHVPLVIWSVFAYDLWRGYREARKDRKPEFVIGGF
jgi:hypothetical protein